MVAQCKSILQRAEVVRLGLGHFRHLLAQMDKDEHWVLASLV